ncbi:hypothetical protein [Bacillus luti]|uniref:hypothetical protein n=1 Tax=Bacillus luti TaxID=2026191 RepID=UPI0037729687
MLLLEDKILCYGSYNGRLKMPFENDQFTKDTIIKHFKRKNKNFTYDEATFITIIQNSNSSKNDVYFSVLGLRDVGTRKCIPFLKQLIEYPMQDVKDCSISSIAHIAGEDETEFYVSVLERKGTRKDYPMWVIVEAANHQAIEAVIKYLESVYKKWRQPKCDYAGDAYLDGLIYLSKHLKMNENIIHIFDKFILIKDKMPEGVKEELKKESPYFSDKL